jgi:hemoglobin
VLHTGSFAGNVMEKHAELHRQLPLEPQHFQRWLQLFAHSLQQHFQGPNATLALTRAQGIAWLMENRVLGPKPPAPPT